jgi:hypothetical protein
LGGGLWQSIETALLMAQLSLSRENQTSRASSRTRAAARLWLLLPPVFCFLAGAAAMHFAIFPAPFLYMAFKGAEQRFAPAAPSVPPSGGGRGEVAPSSDARAWNGFTLITTTKIPAAKLINMKGKVMYQWTMPTDVNWTETPDAPNKAADALLRWQRCHVYANGDLLVLCVHDNDTRKGCGLLKLDKDSKVLWTYAANVHDDFCLAEDGSINVLTSKYVDVPPPDLDWMPSPFASDYLVKLSKKGKELQSISILEAFRNTPYVGMLLPNMETTGKAHPELVKMLDQAGLGPPEHLKPVPIRPDVLHANSVDMLRGQRTANLPGIQAGQFLVSLRTPSVLAVLDVQKGKVVWAAKDIWQFQHDAHFLDNGHLLVFDNFGSMAGARVFEYDPTTQGVSWLHSVAKEGIISSDLRGVVQRLPNGNTLIVDSQSFSVVEVAPNAKITWRWTEPNVQAAMTVQDAGQPFPRDLVTIVSAKRYAPNDLPFLRAPCFGVATLGLLGPPLGQGPYLAATTQFAQRIILEGDSK